MGFGIPAVCSRAADQAVLLQGGAAALWPAPGRLCPCSVSAETVKDQLLLFCQLPPAFSSCPAPQEPSWLRRLLPWGCACALMHCRGSWKRQSRVFIEEMSSGLPAAFTAFHSLKGWEVFLLPATQSTLSLELLSAQLEQNSSLGVAAPGCPACHPQECGKAGLAESWSPAALATLTHSCCAKLVLLEAGISSLHGEKDPWWVREVANGSS